MSETKIFTAEIEVDERPDHTEARALVDIEGQMRGGWGARAATPSIRTVPASAPNWRSPEHWSTSRSTSVSTSPPRSRRRRASL